MSNGNNNDYELVLNKKVVAALLISLIIIILGLTLYICSEKGILFGKKSSNDVNDIERKTKEANKGVVDNVNLNDKIKFFINVATVDGGFTDSGISRDVYNGTDYNWLGQYKYDMTLYALTIVENKTVKVAEVPEKYKENEMFNESSLYKLSFDDFKIMYNRLFGDEVDEISDVEIEKVKNRASICPTIILLDREDEVFYMNGGCGYEAGIGYEFGDVNSEFIDDNYIVHQTAKKVSPGESDPLETKQITWIFDIEGNFVRTIQE